METDRRERNRQFGLGLARACAGAAIFGVPLLMTMEMWWLGFHMAPGRLALFLVLFFPLLVLLSWHAGFEPTFSWRDDVVDALVAYAVGFVCAIAVLGLLGMLGPGQSLRDHVGKVSLQAVPGSIGALLAQTQLGEREEVGEPRGGPGERYGSELFVMAVGALFLAFNLAPTEEMLLLAWRMSEPQAVVLIVVTLALMHAFVYGVAFRGRPQRKPGPGWSLFLRFTVPGYALAALLSAYMLWSFGALAGLAAPAALQTVAVLAFPAALGAATARLVL